MANRTIYVSNILSQLPQEVISAFFSSCGTITNFKLAGRADQPTRYAFIEFAETAHAHSAISLSGTDLAGRKLKITMSHSPINSPPSSSNSGNNRNNNSSSSSSSSSSDSHHQNRSHHHSHHRHQRSNNDHSSPSPSNNNINSSSNSSNNSNMNNVNIADAIERTVYVTNIDSQLKEEQLCEFFTYCGQINHYKICGDGKQPTRFAFFEFASRQFVNDALCLNDQFLGGHKIKVSKSRTAIQPNSQPQNNNQNNSSSSSMNTNNNSNSSSGNQNSGGNNTSKNNNAQNYSTPHYQDQIGRTVYVGNVDVSVTEDDLYEFFNQLCGSVVKVALAGDSEHAARFAFVEFATTDSRNDALTKTGKILCNRSIRVNASRTPILGGGKTYSAGSVHYSNASSNQDQYIDSSAPIRENTDWDTPAAADDDWSNHNHHNSKRKRSNESDDSSDSDYERETEHHNKKMRMEPSDGGYAVAISPNNNNSNYTNDDDYDNKW